jgi:hypothetical protein
MFIKGICGTCSAGTDERAIEKMNEQEKVIDSHCPILECAVKNQIGYCSRDCEEFPCAKFESGLELIIGPGPFPYSKSFIANIKGWLSKKRLENSDNR